MGADIKKLRGRIKSIDSTLHLTSAMGLVASSKIKRATDGMNKGREYAKAIGDAISALSGSAECKKSPYMQKRETEKLGFVVIAGDRGLAGGYNANIFRLAGGYEPVSVMTIGKRACERYGKDLKLAEGFSYGDAILMAKELCEKFVSGEIDKVGIVCTKYISIMSQEAQIEWILPLEQPEEKKGYSVLFEPDEMTILNAAIYEYVAARIMAAARESYASEVAARRVAMDSAGKNAQQMLDDLQLKYNRARQSAITQEITEIVAGSDV